MAATNYDASALVAGTATTWKPSGGTYALSLTGLLTGAARQGVKSATLLQTPPGLQSAILPEVLRLILQTQFTGAPTAAAEVSLWLGFSDSATAGTDNPGGLTGTDAGVSNTDVLGQLLYAGSLVASNSLGTAVQLAYLGPVAPLDQYVCPVVYNQSGSALDNTGSHHILTMIPYYRVRTN